jgi:oligoendopeptidase F
MAIVFASVGATSAVNAADAPARWNLADLYATQQAWSDAYQRTRTAVAGLDRYKGTLGESAEAILKALATISDTRKEVSRLSVYASLKSDEDLRKALDVERQQQARSLFTELAEDRMAGT